MTERPTSPLDASAAGFGGAGGTAGASPLFSPPPRPAPDAPVEEWRTYAEKLENRWAAAEHYRLHLRERLAGTEGSRSWRMFHRLQVFCLETCLGRFPRLRHRVVRMLKVLLREGVRGAGRRLADRSVGDPDYEAWLARHQPAQEDLERLRAACAALPPERRPLISILMPVYNPRPEWLKEALASVRAQLYPHWELCVVDDASTAPHVRPLLEKAAAADKRIRPLFRKANGHICRASQDALDAARGEFVALLDHDDALAPEALARVVLYLAAAPDTDMLYSDEDKLEPSGRRTGPYFKPRWAPEMFMSNMYTCHLGVYRTRPVREVGGFRPGYEGAQDYDLVLRLTEKTDKIAHLPYILYHWRRVPGSTALRYDQKGYADAAARRALTDAVARRGWDAEVEPGLIPSLFRVRRRLQGRPTTTIIIPFRDQADVLRRCVRSIREKTAVDLVQYRLLLLDNGSREKATAALLEELKKESDVSVLRDDEPFNFSRLNNRAAREADGEFLLFLNNDTEVISAEWLAALVEHGQRPEIGAVGAKLLYPDGRTQHAGVVLGIGEVAGHAHRWVPDDNPGYYGSAAMVREFSAVTGACLLTRRKLFLELGGLDEKNLAVAYNDVDYCLRLRERGLRIIYTPYAKLFHHESLTRGAANNPREAAYMAARWGRLMLNDPYYNPALSRTAEWFAIGW